MKMIGSRPRHSALKARLRVLPPRFRVLSFAFACVLNALLLPGCAGVRVEQRAEKGLLQLRSAQGGAVAAGSVFQAQPSGAAEFAWPLKQGQITSLFGSRRRDFHEGIDIRALRGTPVYAAKAGKVIYSSRKIHGYGNMIVVRHGDGTSTVYAHNKKNLAHRGQIVGQGQLIAEVGATGKATGPHLHFEIRKGELPQDPLLYLPQVRVAQSSIAQKALPRSPAYDAR